MDSRTGIEKMAGGDASNKVKRANEARYREYAKMVQIERRLGASHCSSKLGTQGENGRKDSQDEFLHNRAPPSPPHHHTKALHPKKQNQRYNL